MLNREVSRKVRSDKKRDVQPTVTKELKDCIYRLSYITDVPVKDVAEQICIAGFCNQGVLSYLARNFRRDVRIDHVLYMGDIGRVSVNRRNLFGRSERISIRFKSNMYENLSILSYALDCSVARATSLLLDATVRDVDFINEFVRRYISEHMDEKRMNELKNVLKYINGRNPHEEEISWTVFLSYLMKEVKVSAEKVQDTVAEFVINHWKR